VLHSLASTDITLQLDYDLIEYVSQLREGILEAYTGIVTGLKNTEKGKTNRLPNWTRC
jgi:hypothetical protein